MKHLISTLDRIDRKGYGAYKDLSGSNDFDDFTLFIDKIQRDPFAPPSLVRIRMKTNGFDASLFENAVRRFAFEDFLTRRVDECVRKVVRGDRGTGGSGKVEIQRPSQIALPRTSMVVADGFVEARMALGLPAQGRSVDARAAKAMLLDELPEIVDSSLSPENTDTNAALSHVETVEDAEALRELLPSLGLVAFVADGARLPRESGASDRPLGNEATPFESPPEMRVSVELPNHGEISGMGIPEGVSLIVGGGFHGKSTLLDALSVGVYDHAPGDGREFVVSRSDSVKIRAEDGRSVAGVDISAMIGDLPGGKDTGRFSTPNASGSTSQAANISEALEIGTSLLLVDEDTSATNFMVRDERMRELVRKEPISPFIELVKPLHENLGVSTIIVVGGVGDYLDIADRVILMEDYVPSEATPRAAEAREKFPPRAPARSNGGAKVEAPSPRTIRASAINLRRGKKETARGRGMHAIEVGRERVELSHLEQLAEPGQTEAIARIVGRFATGKKDWSLCEIVEGALGNIEADGLDSLGHFRGHPGEMSLPRSHEIAATINRVRSLKTGSR